MGFNNTKYVQFIDEQTEAQLTISNPHLIIQDSTIPSAGKGCFAGEFIPKDTMFCRSNPHDVNEQVDSRFMNDLAYKDDASAYPSEESDTDTNISYVSVTKGYNVSHAYCKAVRDIEAGEELSRYYGKNYWLKAEFDQTYGSYIDNGQLPPVYTFIDEYRYGANFNSHIKVFGKCVDGKYYYAWGCTRSTSPLEIEQFASIPIFPTEQAACEAENSIPNETDRNTFKYLIDISKPDNAPYLIAEPIDNRYSNAFWDTEEGRILTEKKNNEQKEVAEKARAEEELVKKQFYDRVKTFTDVDTFPPFYVYLGHYTSKIRKISSQSDIICSCAKNKLDSMLTGSELFGKCVDGKYYYAFANWFDAEKASYDIESFASVPIFPCQCAADQRQSTLVGDAKYRFKYMLDVSKPDNSAYVLSEPIYSHLYSDLFWDTPEGQQLETQMDLQEKKDNFYRQYQSYIDNGSLPPVYTLVDTYGATPGYQPMGLYGKCANGKYYYVTGRSDPADSYNVSSFAAIPVFHTTNEVLEHTKTFETEEERSNFKYLLDVTKPDFSVYDPSEPIHHNFYSNTFWTMQNGDTH